MENNMENNMEKNMEKNMKFIGFRLDIDLYEKLTKKAKNDFSSVSREIRLAILNHLGIAS